MVDLKILGLFIRRLFENSIHPEKIDVEYFMKTIVPEDMKKYIEEHYDYGIANIHGADLTNFYCVAFKESPLNQRRILYYQNGIMVEINNDIWKIVFGSLSYDTIMLNKIRYG